MSEQPHAPLLHAGSVRTANESHLVLLGLIGGGVILALIGALFLVQRSLDRSQRRLADRAVPAEARIAQLELALNAAFRRQSHVAATTTAAQLEPLRDRRAVEEPLREAARSSAVDVEDGALPGPDLAAHVERFLRADTAFFGAIEQSHALGAAFQAELADGRAHIRTLVEEARSLSGVLRLDYALQLRGIAASLERGAPRADLVRAATLGPGRGARYTTLELVESLLELDARMADLDAASLDQLNSLTANVLPQSTARIERLLGALAESSSKEPELGARVETLARQFRALLPEFDERSGPGLLSLHRRALVEEVKAEAIRAEAEAAAAQLEADQETVHRDVVALTARSLGEASVTRAMTLAFSLLVALVGLLGCIFAARRLSQGIDELTRTNRTLTALKEGLTSLNASLDERVAERTRELSGANARLKEEIVHREKVELELRLAQKLEALGRLAAGVAHEVNTPIQFVSDSVHFVQDAMRDLLPLLGSYQQLEAAVAAGTATPALTDALAAARDDADLGYLIEHLPRALTRSVEGLGRVADIVRSLKEFAHPDQTEMRSHDLNRAIESTLTMARGEYKLVADVEVKAGKIPAVTCHPGEVNQVLLNIIVNAAHAIEDVVRGTDKKGLIRIETAEEGDSVAIRISDTGAGIPVEIRDRVFDPFFTTKEVGRGTGQGLAIARSVIQDKHKGSISFASAVGRGTTFTIRLPIENRAS